MILLKEEAEDPDAITSRPVLISLKQNKPFIYFNKESILKEELQDLEDLEYYLEDVNISFALYKIFQMNIQQKSPNEITNRVKKLSLTGNPYEETADSSARSVISDFNSDKEPVQLIKRLKLDDTQDSDLESNSSICIESFHSTPTRDEENCMRQDVEDNYCDHYLHADLLPLFWLMSLLPDPAVHTCKRIMNAKHVDWKLDLFDVTMVLLNWGASLESLGLLELENFLNSHSHQLQQSYNLAPNSEDDFPSSTNVIAVLQAIQQYLDPDLSEMELSLLLKALVRVAMDKTQTDNIEHFRVTLAKIVDSFEAWDHQVALRVCRRLELSKLPLEHSVFISCSVLDQRTQRLRELRLLCSHHLLHHHFRFPEDDGKCYFNTLVLQLSSEVDLIQFNPGQWLCLLTLLNSLILHYQEEPSQSFQEGLRTLYSWALSVRVQMLRCLDSTFRTVVSERLSVLTARCSGCLTGTEILND